MPKPFPEVIEGEGGRTYLRSAVGSVTYEPETLVGLCPILNGEGNCHL